MTISFKSRFRKLFKWSTGLFLLLFVFRLIYGYVSPESGRSQYNGEDFFNSLENVRKNYASENIMKKSLDAPQPSMVVNQKYDKTASIKTKSSEFDRDERSIKAKAKAFNAVIQYEQNTGQKGNRQIHLLIGVNPTLFDSFCLEIQKIGLIKAIGVTKVDKTNEYKQLNAKKMSLEKTLASLNELKARAGEIFDFVTLHDKILEIEDKLQELGVDLGDFDTENEFCTVKLSLYEGATEIDIRFIQRLKVAFEWTIKFYTISIISLLGLSALVFLILVIIDKLKVVSSIASKMNE